MRITRFVFALVLENKLFIFLGALLSALGFLYLAQEKPGTVLLDQYQMIGETVDLLPELKNDFSGLDLTDFSGNLDINSNAFSTMWITKMVELGIDLPVAQEIATSRQLFGIRNQTDQIQPVWRISVPMGFKDQPKIATAYRLSMEEMWRQAVKLVSEILDQRIIEIKRQYSAKKLDPGDNPVKRILSVQEKGSLYSNAMELADLKRKNENNAFVLNPHLETCRIFPHNKLVVLPRKAVFGIGFLVGGLTMVVLLVAKWLIFPSSLDGVALFVLLPQADNRFGIRLSEQEWLNELVSSRLNSVRRQLLWIVDFRESRKDFLFDALSSKSLVEDKLWQWPLLIQTATKISWSRAAEKLLSKVGIQHLNQEEEKDPASRILGSRLRSVLAEQGYEAGSDFILIGSCIDEIVSLSPEPPDQVFILFDESSLNRFVVRKGEWEKVQKIDLCPVVCFQVVSSP